MRSKGEKLRGGESVSVTVVDRELNVKDLVGAYMLEPCQLFWHLLMKWGHLKYLTLRYTLIEEEILEIQS